MATELESLREEIQNEGIERRRVRAELQDEGRARTRLGADLEREVTERRLLWRYCFTGTLVFVVGVTGALIAVNKIKRT